MGKLDTECEPAILSVFLCQSSPISDLIFSLESPFFSHVSVYSYISILSSLTLLPFALIVDGAKYGAVATSVVNSGWTLPSLFGTMCLAGFLHFLYNQFSYVVLQRVNPVTHAVGNTMKRVAVIVSSVLVFGNEVTPLNKIGTAIAIFGVALYSQVKRLKPAKKTN